MIGPGASLIIGPVIQKLLRVLQGMSYFEVGKSIFRRSIKAKFKGNNSKLLVRYKIKRLYCASCCNRIADRKKKILISLEGNLSQEKKKICFTDYSRELW